MHKGKSKLYKNVQIKLRTISIDNIYLRTIYIIYAISNKLCTCSHPLHMHLIMKFKSWKIDEKNNSTLFISAFKLVHAEASELSSKMCFDLYRLKNIVLHKRLTSWTTLSCGLINMVAKWKLEYYCYGTMFSFTNCPHNRLLIDV